ncbi:MAG TPA: NB-ARC domain-containing protein [Burkholderiaceae bacterium]|jgi:predicted ATPase
MEEGEGSPDGWPPAAGGPSLPELAAPLIGRSEAIEALKSSFAQHRLVSIVGPGGMGKTSLAIAVARELTAGMSDGVHFVDLARHASAGAMAQQLAVTLGLEASPGDALPALLAMLRGMQTLIVLDGCEVAIDAAAELVEAIIEASPQSSLLTTGREALNAADEWVHPIEPLACPPEAALPLWLLSGYPALQLFTKVAGASDPAFRLSAEQALAAGAICRRLDGNPLAITLAASHVQSLGLDGVAAQIDRAVLDWCASSPAPGQADPPSRHQSLEAVLDWSFHLLSADERRVFCSLATFRANFDLDAAVAVAGGARAEAASLVLDLLSKSLLTMQNIGGEVCYRFLDTTRSYAERALTHLPAAEIAACRLRHADCLIRLLQASERQWDLMVLSAWRRRYGAWADDVRAALSWAYAEGGNIDAGVRLTLAAMPMADQTNLIVDYLQHARRALTEVQAMNPRRPELEMRLYTAPIIRQMGEALSQAQVLDMLTKASDLGRDVGTVQAQLGGLLALWSRAFQTGGYRESVQRTLQMQDLADAHGDPVADITAMRTRAQNRHFLGDHTGAKALALRICALRDLKLPLAYMPSPVSMAVSMRIVLARIHWLEGHAEQAWEVANEGLRLAEDDHPMGVCQTLALTHIPLAIWCGRREEGERAVEALAQMARRYAHAYWGQWADVLGLILRGDEAQMPEHMRQDLLSADHVLLRDHLVTMQAGELAHDSLERVNLGEVGWCAPEALRMEAERLGLAGGERGLLQARSLLERSLRLARSQGALAWELRTAMSALRLEQGVGDVAAAMRQLAAVRARFIEGLDTRDLRETDRLLGY